MIWKQYLFHRKTALIIHQYITGLLLAKLQSYTLINSGASQFQNCKLAINY